MMAVSAKLRKIYTENFGVKFYNSFGDLHKSRGGVVGIVLYALSLKSELILVSCLAL